MNKNRIFATSNENGEIVNEEILFEDGGTVFVIDKEGLLNWFDLRSDAENTVVTLEKVVDGE